MHMNIVITFDIVLTPSLRQVSREHSEPSLHSAITRDSLAGGAMQVCFQRRARTFERRNLILDEI